MAYYRILKPVSKGGPVGSLNQFAWLNDEQRARLVEVRAISRLSAPPLEELPGWERRSKKLRKFGIRTAEQFLELDDVEAVAEGFRVKPSTVERWQDEVLTWLIIPEPPKR